MQKIWYYTTKQELEIFLLTAKITVPKTGRRSKIQPKIWVSSNIFWDETPNVFLKKDNYLYDDSDSIRIELPVSIGFKNWQDYINSKEIPAKQIEAIEIWVLKMGFKTSDWFYTAKDIPIQHWITVECYKNKWVAISC